MKRIFYLITELDIGGAEKTLFELATRLDRDRFEPVVGCLTGHGLLGERLERAGVEVVYLDLRGAWDIAGWLRLRRALRRGRPDVLHCFLFHANVAGRVAALGLGIGKVISSVRVEEPRRFHLWISRFTRRWVDIVTCVSESARQYCHDRMRIPLEKLVTVPNGIDPDSVPATIETPPEEWDIAPEVPVVGVIGRIHEQKDPHMMLRVAARVVASVPDALFVFAGDGPLLAECRAYGASLGIDHAVRWIGWQGGLMPLYARMNALALASRWEGMPNVVLEAMAYGKPVVATAVGGSRELVDEGRTGYLIQRGASEEAERDMSAHLIGLLGDSALQRDMGIEARKRVRELFSVGAMVIRNEELYA
jgi:glycosyltransferase involved in cell wall biosynthesis